MQLLEGQRGGGAGGENLRNQPGFCFVHGASTTWWKRGDDLLCQSCHPDPATVVPAVPLIRNVRTHTHGPSDDSRYRPWRKRGAAQEAGAA
jgi:hypothetical protein